MEQDKRPGTKTADPAEGKRDDAPTDTPPTAAQEVPGTMTQAPAEGGDDTTGAARPPR